MQKEYLTDRDDIFVVRDFLTPAECKHYIARAEAAGFGDAPINGLFGPEVRKDVRNNDRLMADDPALAAALWEKARPHVPATRGRWHAYGLNERFRFYRYTVGQQFRWHFDGPFTRDVTDESALTFMVYLNDGFAGGDTEFNLNGFRLTNDDIPFVRVTPAAGTALVFAHRVLHQGSAVVRGTKYVLRTDVMYRWADG